ncbi:BamA/TamA family outer membrane protein [Comamonadaceae bacterium G21597-S1]|nr:BamA/TamA family outer membrane protein [Comamonadaceae bacterium G21597-S1]
MSPRLWGGLVAAAFVSQLGAQVVPPAVDPGALQQQRLQEERRREEAQRLQRAPVPDPLKAVPAPPPPPPVAPGAVRFPVREIRFTASDILTAQELDAIARDYQGRELAFGDLQVLTARVNALYQAQGIVTAQAIVPPQDVSGGVVTIRLVEGRVGAINLVGNDSTDAGYVTDRIGLQPNQLVRLKPLEDDLIRFNRTNDAQLRAELKPGTQFGTTDLNLTMVEPPRHDLRFFLDNSGGDATGKWRSGLAYMNRSLLGWRDQLTLNASRAAGQESYGLGYSVPINRSGGRLGVSWNKDLVDTKFGPLAPLHVTGRSVALGLSVRQPVHVDQALQVDLVANASRRTGTSWISGVFLQETETTDASIGAELQATDTQGAWFASYTHTGGKARVSGAARDDRFWVGRGSLRRTQILGERVSLRASFNFQHTGSPLLPASQQFFIGGETSVRGYATGAYGGDSGHSLSLELHHPLGMGAPDVANSGFFFVDHGRVKPFRPPASLLRPHDELTSVGWGILTQWSGRVSTRLTLAYAPNELPNQRHDYRVHFQLVAGLL